MVVTPISLCCDVTVVDEERKTELQEKPLVSVLTASYNMGHFITEAIESVARQSYANIQHVIIDDGSTDDTKQIVEPYLKDSRLEFHYQANQGQTVAKNAGLKRARGDFICYLDADNLWYPDKLEKQLKVFSGLPAEYKIVYTLQEDIDGQGKVIPTPANLQRYHSGRISGHLLADNFVTFNTAMIRKICFEDLGGFDESLARSIDYELFLRFSTKYEFHFIPEITTSYRIWEGQMSQDKGRRHRAGLMIMERFLSDHPDLVEPDVVRKARGRVYTTRGDYHAGNRQYREAVGYFLRSLRYDPFNIVTYKGIVKMALPFLKRNQSPS